MNGLVTSPSFPSSLLPAPPLTSFPSPHLPALPLTFLPLPSPPCPFPHLPVLPPPIPLLSWATSLTSLLLLLLPLTSPHLPLSALLPLYLLFPSSLHSCPYLHRTAGDTERRYHLRYYKTSTCVYETDSRGYCVKNGPHCAFAHGPNDLRPPVYDVRELQGVGRVEDEEGRLVSPLVGSLEKDRGVLVEDPRWQGK